MAIMDVATMGAAMFVVPAGAAVFFVGRTGLVPCRKWLASIKVCVWLEGVGLLLHLAPCLLLSVSSDSAASVSTSVAVLLASLALLLFELHRLLTL